jgi:hypothetical protein
MVENFPVEIFQKVFCDVGTVWSGMPDHTVPGVDGFQPNHTTGRPQESMTIPKAAHTAL